MFKQIILPIAAVVIFIIAVGIFVQKSSTLNLQNSPFTQPTALPEKSINIGGKVIQTEIADTEAKRTKGLSGITSLDTNSGMLFIFDTQKESPVFWMKDMQIPIDIIWIKDGKVVRIDKNTPIPAPGTPDNKLKTYSPGQTVDYVLEVNAGFSDQDGIKVGDSVDISKI